jgi:hypothetical protein
MCTVDWPKAVGVVKDLVLAGAAIVTARAALMGITKWRSEEKGKADFDLARRSLQAVFRFEAAFQRARSPFTSGSEFPQGYDPMAATPREKAGAWAHVFQARIDKAFVALMELDALKPEMGALWGDGDLIDERLYGSYSTLRSAMDLFLQNERQGGALFNRRPELEIEVNAQVFDTPILPGDGEPLPPTELTTRVKEAVKESALRLRRYLPTHKTKKVENHSQQK